MRTRLLTASALLPAVVAIYFGPSWLFFLLALLATGLMTRETLALMGQGDSVMKWPMMLATGLVLLAFARPESLPVEGALAAAAAFVFGTWLLLHRTTAGAHVALAALLFALVFPGLLMGFQVGVRGLGDEGWGGGRIPALLVFQYAAVFGGDAAAYLTGRAVGRIPLAPLVSPKKTVEGFLGGIVGGVLLALLLTLWLPIGLPLASAALLAALLAVAGAFGDLAKSLLKRSAGVKDSGTLLPGHGGMLDRLDGLLFSSPLLLLVLTSPMLEGARGG